MSIRYWIITVALGLTLATLGQAQDQQGQPNGASDEEEESTLPFPIPVEIIENEETAHSRERQEAEARQREIEDLAAQQGMNAATQAMNDATQRMAEYAFWSTLIVGVGTVLLFWTLLLTRQANRAAQNAVKVTREIGLAQIRPYLCYSRTNLQAFGWGDGEGNMHPGMAARIGFKNFGSTPAFIMGTVATKHILKVPGEEVPSPVIKGLNDTSSSMIGPGDFFGPEPPHFTLDEIKDAISNNWRLCVTGKIVYRDTSRREYFSEICIMVVPIRAYEDIFHNPKDLNSMFILTPYGRNNTGN